MPIHKLSRIQMFGLIWLTVGPAIAEYDTDSLRDFADKRWEVIQAILPLIPENPPKDRTLHQKEGQALLTLGQLRESRAAYLAARLIRCSFHGTFMSFGIRDALAPRVVLLDLQMAAFPGIVKRLGEVSPESEDAELLIGVGLQINRFIFPYVCIQEYLDARTPEQRAKWRSYVGKASGELVLPYNAKKNAKLLNVETLQQWVDEAKGLPMDLQQADQSESK